VIEVIQTNDVLGIQSVMMHEDILPTIIDDTWDGTVFQPDVHSEIYLAIMADGELIGVYRLHWITGVTLQIHAHVLKQYRKKWSRASGMGVLKWVLDNIRRCEKVDCAIPTVYPNVRQFVVACGFTHEGTSRNAFKLNNQMHDMHWYGITADEMKQVTK